MGSSLLRFNKGFNRNNGIVNLKFGKESCENCNKLFVKEENVKIHAKTVHEEASIHKSVISIEKGESLPYVQQEFNTQENGKCCRNFSTLGESTLDGRGEQIG